MPELVLSAPAPEDFTVYINGLSIHSKGELCTYINLCYF